MPKQTKLAAQEKSPQAANSFVDTSRKTKFCMYHLQGVCSYGQACAFAHSCAEVQAALDSRKARPGDDDFEGGHKSKMCSTSRGEEELVPSMHPYKRSLCRWNEKGKCRNGQQCRFAHGESELRAAEKIKNARSNHMPISRDADALKIKSFMPISKDVGAIKIDAFKECTSIASKLIAEVDYIPRQLNEPMKVRLDSYPTPAGLLPPADPYSLLSESFLAAHKNQGLDAELALLHQSMIAMGSPLSLDNAARYDPYMLEVPLPWGALATTAVS
jgi:hypothetical protein